jgi:hypothetical protein
MTASDFFKLKDGKSLDYFGISPIELDEEWLERFEFRHSNSNGGEYLIELNSGLHFTYYSDGIYIDDNSTGDSIALIECKHVHQLQNLYFALTGEELTIKE